MPSRNLLQYGLITLKGLAMGAADVVPGVSGGTIAFISGIYEELISTIHRLDLGFFKHWKKEGFIASWRHYNLNFLFALFTGIIVSILSLAKVISWLLNEHPIWVWSFFFGLIIASIVIIARQIPEWKIPTWTAIVLSTVVSYLITVAEPAGSPDSTWFLFFAGFIAIIAMILPGISGAFILLLLGAYTAIIDTLTTFVEGISGTDKQLLSQSGLKLLVFALGAVTGLKVFSRALNWMFEHYKNLTLAVLTGFMIGALNKVWPWKMVLEYRTNHNGEEVPFLEKSIWPVNFEGDPQLGMAVLLMLAGFLFIFILERAATFKRKI